MGLLSRRRKRRAMNQEKIVAGVNYASMKKAELLEVALEKGISVPEGATKQELLDLLED